MADTEDAGYERLEIESVLKLLRASLVQAQAQTSGALGVRLTAAKVHLSVAVDRSRGAGVGGALGSFIPIGAETSYAERTAHEVVLKLHPAAGKSDLGPPDSDDMAKAIVAVAQATMNARTALDGMLALDSFEISISFDVTSKESARLVVGSGLEQIGANRIELAFRPN